MSAAARAGEPKRGVRPKRRSRQRGWDFSGKDAWSAKNSIPQRTGALMRCARPRIACLRNCSCSTAKRQSGHSSKMRFQRSPLGIEQLSIDQRRDQLLCFVTSHFLVAILFLAADVDLRYCCISFLPRESRERTCRSDMRVLPQLLRRRNHPYRPKRWARETPRGFFSAPW